MSTENSRQVLICGEIYHAKKELNDLKNHYNVQHATSKSREEFIQDLKTKYSRTEAIYFHHGFFKIIGSLDKDLIVHFPNTVKAVCTRSAGYDKFDFEALAEQNIQLANTPTAVDRGTSETALYLTLGALRNFSEGAHHLRQGKWKNNLPLGNSVYGKVLGIIGMGGIGRTYRDCVAPLGFKKVIYYNRSRLSPELEKDSEYVELDQLYAQSDVIALSVPLSQETYHLITKDTISKMKTGVVIINTSRGAVIKESDLVEGLKSGKIKSVGLDVFEYEPKIHPYLLDNQKVLLLPHMGAHSVETSYDMEVLTLENIRSALETGNVITLVNEQKDKFE